MYVALLNRISVLVNHKVKRKRPNYLINLSKKAVFPQMGTGCYLNKGICAGNESGANEVSWGLTVDLTELTGVCCD